jgi:hypothetical protein
LTLAVVLLAGAGLMARSFFKLYAMDLGFGADHLVTFGMDLMPPAYQTRDDIRRFAQELESRAAALPGVDSAAVTSGVPPRDRVSDYWKSSVWKKAHKSNPASYPPQQSHHDSSKRSDCRSFAVETSPTRTARRAWKRS